MEMHKGKARGMMMVQPLTTLVAVAAMVVMVGSVVAQDKFLPLSYDDLTAQIESLGKAYPDLVRVTTAQEEFGLPSPGMCGKMRSTPCLTHIMHVTNFSTYERDRETRPEVYISGELHGDERIGPHAALEFVRLLVQSENVWVRRLLNTRSIVLTPITNSLGFDRNTREEGSVDPNRDYPIDQQPNLCMRAIASRIANELYRSHMFQVAITFHAGMEAIAMEWGTKTRLAPRLHKSPDDFALLQIGAGLASYAGAVSSNGRLYPVGRMNDLVYPVEGGMEDWAYAGNWDPDSRRQPCTPSSFGGYAVGKTQYTDDMLRTVNILVETSDAKWPGDFGSSTNLLNSRSGTGHVARNVRLALALTDLVEPYIVWTSVNVIPSTRKVIVKWEVGGAFDVDDTSATIELKSNGKVLMTSPNFSGRTRWATNAYADRGRWPFRSQFSVCFCLPTTIPLHAILVVRARARVDSAWAMTGLANTVSPSGFAPQTHLVNARTNPAWDKSNAGRRVRGKLDWDATPLEVKMAPPPPVGRRFLRPQNRRLLDSGDIPALDDDDNDEPVCITMPANVVDSLGQNDSNDPTSTTVPNPDESSRVDYTKIASTVSYSFVSSAVAFLAFCGVCVHMYRTRTSATHSRLPVEPESVSEG